ncbi:MAG: glycosyl transferase family 2 [Flavobacterium sp.]|nr:glycosyl transferase family 2 [Flavobacterium sp.]
MIQVSAIIPAYNEEIGISTVIEVCKKSSFISEIIVVDDGSKDLTSLLASNLGVIVLSYGGNKGKAFALLYGCKRAKEDCLLLLDADLIGLTVSHIEDLVQPVINGEADSTIGLFSGGRFKTDLAHAITPNLSGQRCISKKFMLSLASYASARYGIEVAITRHQTKENKKIKKVYLENVTHIMKEEKTGRETGFISRMQMYKDILIHVLKYEKKTKL